MKLTYNNNGYKGYEHNLCGYVWRVFVTPDGRMSYGAPWGDNHEDQEMFDNLVYYNKSVYHGTSVKEVDAKIRKFIKEWKEEHAKLAKKHQQGEASQ